MEASITAFIEKDSGNYQGRTKFMNEFDGFKNLVQKCLLGEKSDELLAAAKTALEDKCNSIKQLTNWSTTPQRDLNAVALGRRAAHLA